MNRFQRLLCACALAVGVMATCSAIASAATFYVEERTASPGNPCTKLSPCEKISEAIAKAEKAAPPNTIEVSPEGPKNGLFEETLNLNKAADKELTINGEEEGVIVKTSGTAAVVIGPAASPITISNVAIKSISATAVVDVGATLNLLNDRVEAESSANGVEVSGHGALTVEGGSVIMEADTEFAVFGEEAAVTVSNAKIISGDGGTEPESGGIKNVKGALTVKNTNVFVEGGPKTTQFGIVVEAATSTLIQNSSVRQGSPSIGAIFEGTGPTVEGLRVEMEDAASVVQGVLEEQASGASSFSHLEVLGTWKGSGMSVFAENVTLSDSHLATNAAFARPALNYAGTLPSQGLVVERSVLQAGPKAKPGTLDATTGNVTIDSSEILGGTDGIFYENFTGGTQTLTIAGSTIGPSPGVSFEAPGVVGVEAAANDLTANTVAVNIEGSIVFDSQVATTVHAVNTASVTCSHSAVPSQIQTANLLAGKGEIACASGVNGNTNSSTELASLFSEIGNNFTLSPASSAIDSVPASAIVLPLGLTPSATDLAGNPRVTDGNGDCVAVQDKGALELQGHSASCPAATSSTTVKSPPLLVLKPSITALKLFPSSFLPAPSGATIAKAKSKGKKKQKFGTTISYIDSQAATTTFTVVSEAKGRRQGKSCKQPSKANKRGKPCKLLVKKGSFAHVDITGANSLRFSGRLGGKALAKGVYKLQAVPRNAADSGLTVSKSFTIK